MRTLLLVLGALLCGASATMAGPNAGGVLWVHDLGIIDSQTPPPPPWAKPSNCGAVDNNAVVYTALPSNPWSQMWKVYAAFPGGSSPRLRTACWRTEFSEAAGSPYSFVSINSSACRVPDEDGAGTDFFIGDLGFPTASGGQIGQFFPTGPRTSLVTTLFIFGGYGYNAGGAHAAPIWATAQYSDPAYCFFGDDAVPVNLDPIMGYSTLGFGAAGNTACPLLPTGACCNSATGACTITTQVLCTFTWLGVDTVCNTQACPVPTGSCCTYSGLCAVTVQADCGGLSVWTAGGNCTPNPCSGPGVGACCTANGDCTVTLQTVCTGTWTMYGTCDPNPCPLPTGACCDDATGACTIATQADCVFAWLGAGVPCNAQTCPPPPSDGVCCFATGDCIITTEPDCNGTYWLVGGVCSPNPCDQPPPVVGACCDEATGGCTITTAAACQFHWLRDGVPCDDGNCHVPIPVERTSWGQIKNIYR